MTRVVLVRSRSGPVSSQKHLAAVGIIHLRQPEVERSPCCYYEALRAAVISMGTYCHKEVPFPKNYRCRYDGMSGGKLEPDTQVARGPFDFKSFSVKATDKLPPQEEAAAVCSRFQLLGPRKRQRPLLQSSFIWSVAPLEAEHCLGKFWSSNFWDNFIQQYTGKLE